MKNKNSIMPPGLVNTMDIVRGVSEVVAETAIHGLWRALHRYPDKPFASHGDTLFEPPMPPETTRMATVEQNYDSEGTPVDWQREFDW